jgi:hypothetical protein
VGGGRSNQFWLLHSSFAAVELFRPDSHSDGALD